MPQASAETLQNWPHGTRSAYQQLDTNFICDKSGYFTEKVCGYSMTKEEESALAYLIEEWDYGYIPNKLTL